ncbi:hypothetical protein NL676_021376 [Syzygium grande]|nr:hypothetical protein NL676_021376 [Syzygium grande]
MDREDLLVMARKTSIKDLRTGGDAACCFVPPRAAFLVVSLLLIRSDGASAPPWPADDEISSAVPTSRVRGIQTHTPALSPPCLRPARLLDSTRDRRPRGAARPGDGLGPLGRANRRPLPTRSTSSVIPSE